MAIIDLRHLVDPEYDTIEFIGNDDKLEYTLPVKKTMGSTLALQNYIAEYSKKKKAVDYDTADHVEISYYVMLAWIQSFYDNITLEWVKKNISDDLFPELMKKANEIFFPKVAETGKPKKNRKNRRS